MRYGLNVKKKETKSEMTQAGQSPHPETTSKAIWPSCKIPQKAFVLRTVENKERPPTQENYKKQIVESYQNGYLFPQNLKIYEYKEKDKIMQYKANLMYRKDILYIYFFLRGESINLAVR